MVGEPTLQLAPEEVGDLYAEVLERAAATARPVPVDDASVGTDAAADADAKQLEDQLRLLGYL
jgi:hypothetical protein